LVRGARVNLGEVLREQYVHRDERGSGGFLVQHGHGLRQRVGGGGRQGFLPVVGGRGAVGRILEQQAGRAGGLVAVGRGHEAQPQEQTLAGFLVRAHEAAPFQGDFAAERQLVALERRQI